MEKSQIGVSFLFDSFQKKKAVLTDFIKLVENNNYANYDLKKLRVGVKKMRATFLLLGLANAHFHSQNHLKSIKPLFKKAGVLREHLVNQDLLQHYWLSKQCAVIIEDKIKKSIKKDRKKVRKAAAEFYLPALEKTAQEVKELCFTLTVEELRATARQFIAQKITHIKALTALAYNTPELHNIRRHLRIITVLAGLFSQHKLPIMPEPRLQKLKKLQGLLGFWHDREILIAAEKDLMADQPEKSVREEWTRFIHKLQEENQGQEVIIKEALRELF